VFGELGPRSGNPAGRPPAVRYVTEYMPDLLPLPIDELSEMAKDEGAPAAQRIAASLVLDAVAAESDQARAKARDQIMDRLEGRPHVSMEVEHKDTTQKVIVLDSTGNHYSLSLDAKPVPEMKQIEVRDPV